jgi:RHS repeat-associated protein
VTDSYDYDAFGNLINSTGSTPNNYLFAGEQYDPALSLYYNRARYLNTTTGRFWSMDTSEGDDENPISLHKYLYAGENPANMTDPSGHDDLAEVSFSISVSVGLGAAAGYAYTGSLKGAEFGALGAESLG